jgi:hypothetical protein
MNRNRWKRALCAAVVMVGFVGQAGLSMASTSAHSAVIFRLGPPSGPPGTTFEIGVNINALKITKVKIGSASAPFKILGSAALRATVPKGAKTGKISFVTKAGVISTPNVFTVT